MDQTPKSFQTCCPPPFTSPPFQTQSALLPQVSHWQSNDHLYRRPTLISCGEGLPLATIFSWGCVCPSIFFFFPSYRSAFPADLQKHGGLHAVRNNSSPSVFFFFFCSLWRKPYLWDCNVMSGLLKQRAWQLSHLCGSLGPQHCY